jgi:XTP/dITP diphosphohydrolase
VCAFVLALPDGSLKYNQDICEGEIIPEERGNQGFGYDSIFYIPKKQKTMAELEPVVKNRVSHRARAIMGMIPYLSDL